MTTRKELIGALRARYRSAAFGDRSKILDEFVALTGYHRKHAIRLLRDDGSTENGLLVIADALGVTRGSFYWHFTDHADLVAALLERWRKRETELDRQLREESTDDAQGDLTHLLEVALAHAGREVENVRFELALRGLGRRDPVVAKMLLEVDQMRFRLFEQKFMRLTGDARTAADLAALFYLAIAGSHQALSRPSSSAQAKQYLKAVIVKHLIIRQAPAADQALHA